MEKKQINRSNDHDNFFVNSMSNLCVAKNFFKQHLPQQLLQALDLDTLILCKDKLVNSKLRSWVTDMLYRVKLRDSDQDAYIATLIEHQSKPRKHMPLRTLEYECEVMKGHLILYKKVPLVYTIVYYNGQARWHYPTDVKALIDAPKELIERYALKPFQLVELNQIPDEELRKHLWSGLMGIA